MDMRSRVKQHTDSDKASKYKDKRKKLHKSDEESLETEFKDRKQRKSKQRINTSKSGKSYSGIFTKTCFLGVFAFFFVSMIEATYAFDIFVSMTKSAELFKTFETLPNFATSSSRRSGIIHDKIVEEEDIEAEEMFVRSLDRQTYLGEVSLPWENALIKDLQERFQSEEPHTDTADNQLQKAEVWLTNTMMEWLNTGKLDFDQLARKEIEKIKKQGLGQEALSDDIKTILQGRKLLESHQTKYEDLIKKQKLIELQLKKVTALNSSLTSFERLKPIELIIPAEIAALMS